MGKGNKCTNQIAPPIFNIQFLDIPPSCPLARVVNEDVGVSECIFHSLFELFDVRLRSRVDADDENVAFAVYLENFGFGSLELCDAAAGKDKVRRRGFRER